MKEDLKVVAGYFQGQVTRSLLKEQGRKLKVRLYWRTLTPLVVIWGLVVQRLSGDHRLGGVVNYLRQGGADNLDGEDGHKKRLSERLKSESTSGLVQARQRLPLAMVEEVDRKVQGAMRAEMAAGGETCQWQGLEARLLDGTTYRLKPYADLVEAYGRAKNQHGESNWVTVKSVAAFCLYSQCVVGHAEGDEHNSEASLVRAVMLRDASPHSVYVGDINFGQYRVAQVARACNKHVLLRLSPGQAKTLLRKNKLTDRPDDGSSFRVSWDPTGAKNALVTEPDLPCEPIEGRLIYKRLDRPGFRPIHLYLFTDLLDETQYTVTDLVALYGLRWQVELDYRDIKATLCMAEFDVQSNDMFKLELTAGLLSYNLLRALMLKAARQAGCKPRQLSFISSLRWMVNHLQLGYPTWVLVQYPNPFDWLIENMAKCRLPVRKNKVAHEPRAVRYRPKPFPALKTTRAQARLDNLAKLGFQAAQPIS